MYTVMCIVPVSAFMCIVPVSAFMCIVSVSTFMCTVLASALGMCVRIHVSAVHANV